MTIVAVAVALLLSSIAAYFSVLGMTAIFPASFWPIVVMTGTLEAAKIVSVVWLHVHWNHVPRFVKAYLCSAIILLMGITSMGVFGFLSKAHIEHQVKIDSGVGLDIKILDQKIVDAQNALSTVDGQLVLIDTPNKSLVGLSKTARDARLALGALGDSKKARKALVDEQEKRRSALSDLQTQKIKLDGQRELQDAEVGPIKYLADLIYGDATRDQLEKAVRWAIIVLVFVFDPLAIMLLLGSSRLYRTRREADEAKAPAPLPFRQKEAIKAVAQRVLKERRKKKAKPRSKSVLVRDPKTKKGYLYIPNPGPKKGYIQIAEKDIVHFKKF